MMRTARATQRNCTKTESDGDLTKLEPRAQSLGFRDFHLHYNKTMSRQYLGIPG